MLYSTDISPQPLTVTNVSGCEPMKETCSLHTNVACKYSWSTGSEKTFNWDAGGSSRVSAGTYTCMVECALRGKIYSVEPHVIHITECAVLLPAALSSTTTTVLIVSVVAVLLIVAVIIAFILIRKYYRNKQIGLFLFLYLISYSYLLVNTK